MSIIRKNLIPRANSWSLALLQMVKEEMDMSKLNQNDLEYLKDMLHRGEITSLQANVEMVRMAE